MGKQYRKKKAMGGGFRQAEVPATFRLAKGSHMVNEQQIRSNVKLVRRVCKRKREEREIDSASIGGTHWLTASWGYPEQGSLPGAPNLAAKNYLRPVSK